MMFMRKIQLGSQGSLEDRFELCRKAFRSEIELMSESYAMQINEADAVAYLVQKYKIDPPTLQIDQRAAQITDINVPADKFPVGYSVQRGQTYEKKSVSFTIPCNGETELLTRRASKFALGGLPEIFVGENGIAYDIVSFDDDPEKVNVHSSDILRSITLQANWIISDIEEFNRSLPHEVEATLRARKAYFAARNKLLEGLDVPIRLRPGAPEAAAVPVLKSKEKVIPAPTLPNIPYAPNPVLGDKIYYNIVNFLFDAGKRLERLPSTYAGKVEEDIRDHLLLMLDSQFESEASATGETFNKTGKTDILVRYKGDNVFAAECKFWRGPKGFVETIDQLLGYLTWRDGKAAIIIFDRNVGFSKDVETIAASVIAHPNYLSTVNNADKSKSTYTFHLSGDRGLLVTITVLVFHFPSDPKTLADIEKTRWLKHELDKYRLQDSDRQFVIGASGSLASIPDLISTISQHPHLVEELETFLSFALDNDFGEIFEQICVVGGNVQGVRVELKAS